MTEAVDAVKRGLSTRVGQEIVHRLSGTARDGLVGLGAQRPARESARSSAFLGAPGMDVGHRSRPLGRAHPSLGSSAFLPLRARRWWDPSSVAGLTFPRCAVVASRHMARMLVFVGVVGHASPGALGRIVGGTAQRFPRKKASDNAG